MHLSNMALNNVNSKYKARYYFGRIKRYFDNLFLDCQSMTHLVSFGETQPIEEEK